jgi:hypothetical protein
MSAFMNELQVQEYVYDFSVDGGAVGTIDLSAKANSLPSGAVVKRVYAVVEDACTSGGAATVAWGNSGDADGFSGTAKAVASLTANAVFEGSADSAALLPSKLSADSDFSVTIAVAALTAGKIRYGVEYVVLGAY